MSTIAALGESSRSNDWLIAGIVLLASYLVAYPVYLIYVRLRHTRRIKSQLVTSLYKLPISMTPTELAYLFSTKVSHKQLYSTLLHMANRSVVLLEKNPEGIMVSVGPKIEKELTAYENLLLSIIQSSSVPLKVERVLQGFTNHKTESGSTIRGSRQYVFWWLLRNELRVRKLIEVNMTSKYLKMLFVFGVVWSLILAILPVVVIRILQMLDSGEVDGSKLLMTARSGLLLWILVLPVVLLSSFLLLRTRGKMLGRDWLMTNAFKRYLPQLEAYREFVRLTHRSKLRFESKELEQEARVITRPYAIAFGYVKE